MAKREVNIKLNVDAKAAVNDTKKVNEGLQDVGTSANEATQATEKLAKGLTDAGKSGKDGLKDVSKGFKGVGLAIKAAGIGLVIAAFAALKEILEKQQGVLNMVDSAFTAIGLAITTVSKTLKESSGDFDALGKVMKGILTLAITPLKVSFYAIKAAILSLQLGWESSFMGGNDAKKIAELKTSIKEVGDELIEIKNNAIDAAQSIGKNISEAVSEVVAGAELMSDAITSLNLKQIKAEADRIVALKNAAQIAEALNKGRFEAFDREAELLRQVRDDTRLTIKERQEANDKLGVVLDKQEKVQLRLAQISIDAARGQLAANATTENRVLLIQAQNEVEAIQADIAGRRSEQIINEIGLQDELTTKKDEALVLDVEREMNRIALEQELKLLRAEEGLADPNASVDELAEATQARIDVEQEQYDMQLELLATRFADGLVSDGENNAIKELMEYEHQQKLNKIKKDGVDAEGKLVKKGEDDKVRWDDLTNSEKQKAASDTLDVLSSLVAEGSAEAKAIALAQATISGVQGVQAAYTSASSIPIVGMVMGPLAAVAAGVVAGKNIATIAGSSTGSKKAKGGGGGKGFTMPTIAAPPIKEDSLFSSQTLENEDPETLGSGVGMNQIKAVVLESDITEVQNNINNIEINSEMG